MEGRITKFGRRTPCGTKTAYNKVFPKKQGLDNVKSAMCKHQQWFGLDVQCSALVLNFNNIFSNGHLYRAGQSMNSRSQNTRTLTTNQPWAQNWAIIFSILLREFFSYLKATHQHFFIAQLLAFKCDGSFWFYGQPLTNGFGQVWRQTILISANCIANLWFRAGQTIFSFNLTSAKQQNQQRYRADSWKIPHQPKAADVNGNSLRHLHSLTTQ